MEWNRLINWWLWRVAFQNEIREFNPKINTLITFVVEQTIVLHTIDDKMIPKLISSGPAS